MKGETVMAFIPVPDCCEAGIEFFLDAVPSVITLGFRHTGGGGYDISGLADLATALVTSFITPLVGDQTSDVVYSNIHLRSLDAENGAVFDQPLTAVGTNGTSGVANQVSMTVSFLTGIAGRSYRGRNYVAGLPTAALADQRNWNATYIGRLLEDYQTMDLALPAVDSEHVVISRFQGGETRSPGVATPVIGYRPNRPVYTQRRRLT